MRMHSLINILMYVHLTCCTPMIDAFLEINIQMLNSLFVLCIHISNKKKRLDRRLFLVFFDNLAGFWGYF